MNKIDRARLAYKDEIRGVYDRKVFPAPAEGFTTVSKHHWKVFHPRVRTNPITPKNSVWINHFNPVAKFFFLQNPVSCLCFPPTTYVFMHRAEIL